MASQLILQFRDRSIEDRDEVAQLEDALCEMLEGAEALDGSSITSAARNIFVVSEDPSATFARLLPFLAGAGLDTSVGAAIRREGEDTLTNLWPPDRHEPFSLS